VGFKVQRRTYLLRFQGTEFDGLEVKVRSVSTGELIDMEVDRLAQARGGTASEGATEGLINRLIGALVEWNAEDEDGTPIPATAEGVRAQDLSFNMAIINAWANSINGVAAPLSETSSDGALSVEASIPMDVPSESPTS
jgi:hypothetical protein